MAAAVVVVVGPTTNVSGRRCRLKSKDMSGIVILKFVSEWSVELSLPDLFNSGRSWMPELGGHSRG